MAEGSLRALIVDDDRAWQEILAEILRDMGLDVDLAGDHDAAVACLRAASYRLAIVDLSLAGDTHQNRDGLRVLAAVRAYAPGCVPVLLTGFATVELAVGAMTDYGAYTCLQKETFRRASFRGLLWRVLAAPPAARSPLAAPAPPQAAGAPAGLPGGGGLALVVENDAGWRSILAELLADAGFRVAACAGYGEALGCLLREEIALAVVDLSLAGAYGADDNRDGYQVLQTTHAAGIPAVVVSGLAAGADVKRAYDEYGVFAFLAKQTFDRHAFLQTVANACAVAPLRAAAAAGDPILAGQLASLTPREREVLDLLVQGLTNKGIAAALTISVNTVKRYLKLIFDKLEVNSRAAAVAKAVAAGRGPAGN